MKTNPSHLAREGGDAAADFIKDMKLRTGDVKEAEKHVDRFAKYHRDLVKNIEKELNRSQI
jgi:D-serine dehydratase